MQSHSPPLPITYDNIVFATGRFQLPVSSTMDNGRSLSSCTYQVVALNDSGVSEGVSEVDLAVRRPIYLCDYWEVLFLRSRPPDSLSYH